ncbi:MAG: endo-1,4-beta-xylanase [Solirubrobacterales bacterium]|nr:endo-1,4-beta-xylanase [Solirubrobacterales bacterium]
MVAGVAALLLRGVKEDAPRAVTLPGVLREEAGTRLAVGTAVRDEPLREERGYRTVLARQFSSVTPENAMKWAVLEPERGKLDWSAADRLVDFAVEHGQAVRGHTLVWYSQNPAWVEGLKGAQLRQAVREHIRTVVGRYRRKVAVWDVVNEPFEDDGTRRKSVFQRELGDGWAEDALRTARTADAQAKLYINEIGAEAPGPKADAYFALAQDLLARGVPLDGVGFQAHFSESGVPDGFRENLERFAALGLDVAITEADVALEEPADAAALRLQARVYEEVARTCLAIERCVSLTVWGFTDRFSWIPETQPGRGEATLLDERLGPKRAFREVLRVLEGR